VKQTDAHGEDLVESPLAEIQLLEARDEELGPAGRDVLGVPTGRGLDHLLGAVDGGQAAFAQPLTHPRRRHALPASDLEHAVARPDVQALHDRSPPFAHV
jgi:hypothetical protein